MLVFSRKCQESVVVGGAAGGHFDVKVTVVEVRAGKVRLGFDADPAVVVHRGEVWERIRAESGQSARLVRPERHGVAQSPQQVQKGPCRNQTGTA